MVSGVWKSSGPSHHMRSSRSQLSGFYLKIFLVHLVAFTLFRGIIFVLFCRQQGQLDVGEVGQAFRVGFFFDLRLSAVVALVATLLLFLLFPLVRRWPGAWRHRAVAVPVTAWVALGGLVLAVDIANFSYLNEHLNASALRYFEDPHTSLGMVLESYPVLLLLPIAIAGVAVLYRLSFRRLVAPALPGPDARLPWPAMLRLALLSAPLIYGKVSHYPLRWSDAFISSHTFVNQLGLNPLLYFFDTIKNREIDYEEAVSLRYDPVIAAHLGLDPAARQPLSYARTAAPEDLDPRFPEIGDPAEAGLKNVVVIVVESLGAFKIGALGHPLGASPHIDALMAESYTFSQHYSSVAGTARGLFTLVTGLPDVARIETSSRNPLVINQHVLLNQLPQPEKSFWIGGSANWGNIRALFGENISGVEIVEEGDYPGAARNDVWGISDRDLFAALHKELESKEEPFAAVVLTSGYHRPYTIPEDRGGFEITDVAPAAVRASGFTGTKEFHSFRFADHTLGEFFRLAKESSYYAETLFVVTGDHGLTNRGAVQLSGVEQNLDLERFHVPLILHAPALIRGGRIDPRPSDHMDIFPTVAHLLGVRCENRTLGRSLFRPGREEGAFLFLSANKPYHVGWFEDGWFLSYKETGSSKLHAYPSDDTGAADAEVGGDTDRQRRMEDLARAHLEVSRYLLYHNRKDPLSPTHPDPPMPAHDPSSFAPTPRDLARLCKHLAWQLGLSGGS